MPIRRLRLTKYELDEYRTSLLQLETLGIAIGGAGDIWPQAPRFTLEQAHFEFGRVCHLASGEIAALLPARLTVLKSGVRFTKAEMFTPWDGCELDLSDPEDSFLADLAGGIFASPPTILNHLLVGRSAPLRPCEWEGVIIAVGWSEFPAAYRDGTAVTLELFLREQQSAKSRYSFHARVDRSLRRQYQRRRQHYWAAFEKLAKPVPLFGPEKAETVAPGDATDDARTEGLLESHDDGRHSGSVKKL